MPTIAMPTAEEVEQLRQNSDILQEAVTKLQEEVERIEPLTTGDPDAFLRSDVQRNLILLVPYLVGAVKSLTSLYTRFTCAFMVVLTRLKCCRSSVHTPFPCATL